MVLHSLADFVPLFVIGFTLWVMRARFSEAHDISWPLIYYFFLVIFVRAREGEFNNYFIFTGVVAALILRYEFIGGIVVKVVRFVEFVVMCYVILICLTLLTK
ncbi:MAG: hypothetical protein ABIZ80_06375 [Bryobacteraceae bacterium]